MSETRPVNEIAREIARDWMSQGKGIGYAAMPYLRALQNIGWPDENYGHDSARSVALYFLANAQSYRGANARRLKAELKAVFGIK